MDRTEQVLIFPEWVDADMAEEIMSVLKAYSSSLEDVPGLEEENIKEDEHKCQK